MSDVMSKSQSLQGEYEARVTADLAQNESDRDRVAGQISELQKELEVLVQDREMLLSMQSAVGATKSEAPVSEPEAPVTPHAKSVKVPGARRRTARKAVPTQGRAGRGRKSDSKNGAADVAHAPKAAPAKTVTAKPVKAAAVKTAATASTAKPAKAATAKSATARPAKAATSKAADSKVATAKPDKLVKVVENFLVKQGAPASAAEVATAVSTPERAVSIMSVRTALEGLVRKSAALRSKQSRSVYYEAVTAGAAATATAKDDAPQQSEPVTQ